MSEIERRPKSRVRFSSRNLGAAVMGEAAGVAPSFGESRMRNSVITKEKLRSNVEYLKSLQGAAAKAGSYRQLLSGESEFSHPPQGQLGIPDKRILSRLGVNDRSYLTFGAALSGPDYAKLKAKRPNERYKFYSSFDLTTPDKADVGIRWFEEVAKAAHDQGLSMTTKAFDHTYDSLNIYTWDPAKMATIISDLYPKYEAQGLYNDTEHFFQGAIDGVNPRHVGFAQEPIHGWPAERGLSHSARMGVLGNAIDMQLAVGAPLSPEVFTNAANSVGVSPSQPYILVNS